MWKFVPPSCSFSCERFCTKTRFETEAQDSSKMTDCCRSTSNASNAIWNRPYAWSSHMVQNHTCFDAICTVGLPKQSNSYQSTLRCLCLGIPTVQLASQHVWICTMWLDRAKGLLPSKEYVAMTFDLASTSTIQLIDTNVIASSRYLVTVSIVACLA